MTGLPAKGGTCAVESASLTHAPVGVPVKGTPTVTCETVPSLPKVTFADAVPQTLPRRQWAISCDAVSSAARAASAGKCAVGSTFGGGSEGVEDGAADGATEGEGGPTEDAVAGAAEADAVEGSAAAAGWRLRATTRATPASPPPAPRRR